MIDMPQPTGNFYSRFESACGSKQREDYKAALDTLKPAIQERYKEYNLNQRKPELISKIVREKSDVEALESCYSPTLKRELLDDLKRRISQRSGSNADLRKRIRCPYCQIEPATRWDHFLPISEFPDFAMYSPNLIYICEVCNNDIKKSGLYDHPRATINPYFDDFTKAFLVCELGIGSRIDVFFKVITPDDADPYIAGVVERHFKEYQLEEKFLAEAGSIEDQVLQAYFFARTNRKVSAESLAEYIDGRISDMRRDKANPNHWEHALLAAYRENVVELITYFEHKFLMRKTVDRDQPAFV